MKTDESQRRCRLWKPGPVLSQRENGVDFIMISHGWIMFIDNQASTHHQGGVS